ncbi:MAG: GGDEF domain-containing protein, partial [Proteobacteria bacterium]|nr:GGDEF domain-containing protein [Pseudomonadota bacterium]
MDRQFESHRIGLIGGLILIVLTLAAGIAVYALMQRQAESILVKSLATALQNDRRLFESEIDANVANALAVSTRPFVIHNLQQLKAKPDNEASRQVLQQIADSFLPIGFVSVSFHDSHGQTIVHAGHPAKSPALSVPLNTQAKSHLLWDGQLILRVDREVLDEAGHLVGTARTESTLPRLTDAIAEAGVLGKTVELALCAPLEKDMQCFPLTRSQHVFARLARTIGGQPLPMSHALKGETGTVFTQDYRHENVVAAYTPLGRLGPGMVLKIDQAELFGPVRRQLWIIVPLL